MEGGEGGESGGGGVIRCRSRFLEGGRRVRCMEVQIEGLVAVATLGVYFLPN